jgi:hypothetical protein
MALAAGSQLHLFITVIFQLHAQRGYQTNIPCHHDAWGLPAQVKGKAFLVDVFSASRAHEDLGRACTPAAQQGPAASLAPDGACKGSPANSAAAASKAPKHRPIIGAEHLLAQVSASCCQPAISHCTWKA